MVFCRFRNKGGRHTVDSGFRVADMKARVPILAIVVVILSAIVIAAHFLRSGSIVPMALSLVAPFLFLPRQPWARRLSQAFCLAAAGVWVATTLDIARERVALGEDWLRMAIILAAVAVAALFGVVLLEGRRSRKWFVRGE